MNEYELVSTTAQRSDMAGHKVKFLPSDRVFVVDEAETLLEAAMKLGVHINASCGGNSACGKCRIKIVEGDAESPRHPTISEVDYDNGYRLACTSRPRSDLVVEIPLESQVDKASLKRKPHRPHILAASDIGELVKGWTAEPAVFKVYLELPPPSIEDNIADVERIKRALRIDHTIDDVSVAFGVLKKMSSLLRDEDWKVTVTLIHFRGGYRLVSIEPGKRHRENYSAVIDIGTTTLCGQLLDLANCTVVKITEKTDTGRDVCTLAESSDYNSQISYGEDVISRIMYARKKGGLKRLQDAVIATVNSVIRELLDIAHVDDGSLSHLVLAGNTTMTHLALGLDPRHIMLAPYTPTVTFVEPVRAAALGIHVGDHVYAYVFPCVASYVGGDIVAGVLGSGIFQREKITLFMDIGTNGEIVLGNKDWLVCASCSAGPAFEGGGIGSGMRADRGAIEQVRINPATYEPMVLTVGRVKPLGICGSGLIDIVAEMLLAGLIDQNGKLRRDAPTKRIRKGDNGCEYVISYGAETQTGRDIVISEVDLDNLIRTKAAVYAGCRVLLDQVGLTFDDVERVVIAGGFGHYIDLERARTIGLLPELPLNRFLFVGNGSLLGARLLSFSEGLMTEAERIARMMTNIELSNSPKFMDEFVAASFLPHTDSRAFPGVLRELKKGRGEGV